MPLWPLVSKYSISEPQKFLNSLLKKFYYHTEMKRYFSNISDQRSQKKKIFHAKKYLKQNSNLVSKSKHQGIFRTKVIVL